MNFHLPNYVAALRFVGQAAVKQAVGKLEVHPAKKGKQIIEASFALRVCASQKGEDVKWAGGDFNHEWTRIGVAREKRKTGELKSGTDFLQKFAKGTKGGTKKHKGHKKTEDDHDSAMDRALTGDGKLDLRLQSAQWEGGKIGRSELGQ